MGRVVVAGGTGFVGTALVERLTELGYEAVVLSRSSDSQCRARVVQWDGKALGDWMSELDGASAVVNLAGKSLAVKWTDENRRKMRDSRIDTTAVLCEAMQSAANPPAVWVNASAIGWYAPAGDRMITEAGRPGTGFVSELCADWERAATSCALPATRVVLPRFGVVLGEGGGLFEMLSRVTKMFLGGRLGSGRQWVPWIHIEDAVRAVLWGIEGDFRGAFNACSPNPVRNEILMRAMREAYGRPWAPPVPEWAMEMFASLGGPDPGPVLDSRRVVPQIATSRGFEFMYPRIEGAIGEIVNDLPVAWRESANS